MTLFKSDHARRIDRVIDYFGGNRRARRFRVLPDRRGPRLLAVLAVASPRGRSAWITSRGWRPQGRLTEWT